MPKHAIAPLLLLLLPVLIACESNDSPFRDAPEERQAAVSAAEQQLEQAQSQASDDATLDQSEADEPADERAGEDDTQADDQSTDEPDDPNEQARDPDAPPPTELDGFLALRFPEHDSFQTFEIAGPRGDERRLVFAYSTLELPLTEGQVVGIFEVGADRIAALQTLTIDPGDGVLFAEIEQLFTGSAGRGPWGPDLWFLRQGSIGAHGSGADLIRWDPGDAGPGALRIELSWSSATPAAAISLIDIDGDGVPEAWLDSTNPFIFCYACGVREPFFDIARWNGSSLVLMPLIRLSSDTLGPVREAVNFAIALAEANLWQDAEEAITFAQRLAPDDPTVAWDAILIREAAALRVDNAGQAYPLLTHLFAGQYQAAVDGLTAYPPIDLLDPFGPLTRGTPAEGWEEVMAETVHQQAQAALQLRPDYAPALFLRGLAAFWLAPDAPDQAITDINAAAALDPGEPLYEAVANLLTP